MIFIKLRPKITQFNTGKKCAFTTIVIEKFTPTLPSVNFFASNVTLKCNKNTIWEISLGY